MTMTNHAINSAFLAAIDVTTRVEILVAVGQHYGITKEIAFQEVTHVDAEHLLDYLTGPNRTAVSVLMRRHGLITS